MERFKSLKNEIKAQAPLCKSVKIQRVPIIAANILRELDQRNLLGNHIMVVGTNALFAYEATAGVFFDNKAIATEDMDILWDIRSKIKLGIKDDADPKDFIDILRKVDKTFDIYHGHTFRVANEKGYMVDLLKAVEVKNLSWLLSAPKFEQIAIGYDGLPVRIVTPDPRAYALHKFWVSEQKDRDPRKKGRDKEQAIAVAKLVMEHLPYLEFSQEDMQMFPIELLMSFKTVVEEQNDDDEDFSLRI